VHSEGPLCGRRRRRRFDGAREGDEERVPFGAELDTPVRRERLAKDAVVLAEDAGPAIGESLRQDRRALDVREEQRDGARRQLQCNERLPRAV
jgi:hypothetical protein